MKVAVIGHTGFIGSELYRFLKDDFCTFGFSGSNGVDICCADSLNRLPDNCDVIVNCAARLEVTSDNFVGAVDVNVIGALHLAEYARRTGTRLIHISSIFAIEHKDNQYFDGYGASKKSAEDMLQQYAKLSRSEVLILRLPQLYDVAGKAKNSQPMLYRLIEQVMTEKVATVYGSLDPLRNFLNVKDAITLLSLLIKTPLTGTYNCHHPASVKISDIVNKVSQFINIKPQIQFLKDKPDLKTVHIPTNRIIWNKIKYSPAHDILSDIPELIQQKYR